jgi:hypothetical protein
MSSFKLWASHMLESRTQAFINTGVLFYPAKSLFNGYYSYSSPFKPFLGDVSVSGAQVPTGIYVNGILVYPGTSGFVGYNYAGGQAIFNTILPTNTALSGNLSIREIDVVLTSQPDEEILFETKYFPRPKTLQDATGLGPNTLTYPIIFIKKIGGSHQEFAIGGVDEKQTSYRMIVLADSPFMAEAVGGFFESRVRSVIPLLEQVDMPFNVIGTNVSGNQFDYTGLARNRNGASNSAYIDRVNTITLHTQGYALFNDINLKIYPFLIDFDICSYETPRN